ncbi:unnamed protein product [Peronospora belbahrii]|uniref:SCP domain-containing protein n=1 Tax=Peronospora belbahrii TaxID=622444 RepID=A0AAU9KVQ5_9STRA|nr:unnamed protein product [Peronospora belbahrii]
MKVSTKLIVVAALAVLSTTANARSETTTAIASEPYDNNAEQRHLSTPSFDSAIDLLTDTGSAPPADSGEDQEAYGPESTPDDSSISTPSTEGLTTESAEETNLTSQDDLGLTSETSKTNDHASGLTIENTSTEPSESSLTSHYDLGLASETSETDDHASGPGTEDASTEASVEASTTVSNDETSLLGSAHEQTPSDSSFTDEEKSIWIERHNFFRVAGLPWAAGNMKRIGWDNDLAKEAALAAASCAATTSTGINVFKSTSTDSPTVIEEAINAWVIEPSLSNIGSVVPPAVAGDGVGAGLYNAYTQVVWASTTNVGCAMAPCSGGSMVVCQYSPAGNDGKSAWFVHDAQAKQCPTGTTAASGLCIVEGDPANDLIAPVPKDKQSLQVYPTFIADIMAAILKAAQERDAAGASMQTVITPDGPAHEPSSPDGGGLDVTFTDDVMTEDYLSSCSYDMMEPPSDPTTDSFHGATNGVPEDLVIDTGLYGEPTESPDLENSNSPTGMELNLDSTNEDSLQIDSTGLPDLEDYPGMELNPDSTNLDSLPSKSPDTMESLSPDDLAYDVSTDSAMQSLTASSSDTYSSLRTASEPSYESELPGEVKPGVETDSHNANPDKSSSSLESVAINSDSASDTDPTQQDDSAKSKPSKDLTASAKSTDSKTTVLAVNRSAVEAVPKRIFLSPAGIAGIIVLGVVAVAALAVFVSYRKNQQRQRDIMRDGGIEVI